MTSDSHKWLYYFVFLCLCWAFFVWQGLFTAVEIWLQNEIFNHCFFIIPCSVYLVYTKRYALTSEAFEPSLAPLILLLPTCAVYIIGLAGDINLFLHIATFFSLILVVWSAIGHHAAQKILFPLFFILFSIPVGEQLTPYLQMIAATGAVSFLELTGVPLYRNGLYIEIPGGRFLVAEACSGVSFFSASSVIGCIYAYLNFATYKRRCLFIGISVILPVLANIIRVYGIIMIAYLSNMEHAVGADHLVYGWFFFAFVILCLLGIGEFMRTAKTVNSPKNKDEKVQIGVVSDKSINVMIVAITFLLFSGWGYWIKAASNESQHDVQSYNQLLEEVQICEGYDSWLPKLMRPTKQSVVRIGFEPGVCNTRYVNAWFDGNGNELVSDLNRVFNPEEWSVAATFELSIENQGSTLNFNGLHITSPSEERRFIVYWFRINDKIFTHKVMAKLYQTYLTLLGQNSTGEMGILASQNKKELELILQQTSLLKTEIR